MTFAEIPRGKETTVDKQGHQLEVAQSASATNTKVSVGAATTVVLASNADRQYAAFVNDSDEVIYLSFGAAAVMNQGIRLNAAGGSHEITVTNRFTGAVNGICTSGTKNLTIMYY